MERDKKQTTIYISVEGPAGRLVMDGQLDLLRELLVVLRLSGSTPRPAEAAEHVVREIDLS